MLLYTKDLNMRVMHIFRDFITNAIKKLEKKRILLQEKFFN